MSEINSAFHNSNRFRSHPLTEHEVIAASKFSELQKQGMQNLISAYAHDLINVQYDDSAPHRGEYLRNYYRGAIEALEHLLHTDEEVRNAEQELETTARNSQE